MKARVKLMGTLPAQYSGNYPTAGIEVELHEPATLADLVEIIGISQQRLGIITVNGTLAKAGDRVPDGAEVKFLQKIAGG